MARFGQALKPSKVPQQLSKASAPHNPPLALPSYLPISPSNCFYWASKLLHGTFWPGLKTLKSPAAVYIIPSTLNPCVYIYKCISISIHHAWYTLPAALPSGSSSEAASMAAKSCSDAWWLWELSKISLALQSFVVYIFVYLFVLQGVQSQEGKVVSFLWIYAPCFWGQKQPAKELAINLWILSIYILIYIYIYCFLSSLPPKWNGLYGSSCVAIHMAGSDHLADGGTVVMETSHLIPLYIFAHLPGDGC